MSDTERTLSTPAPPADAPAPSKSQRKRDAQALLDLARQLAALPGVRFDALSLPDELAEALREARALRPGGARKRQLKFVAKLLRNGTADPALLHALQNAVSGHSRHG